MAKQSKVTVAEAETARSKAKEEQRLETARANVHYGRSYGKSRTKEQKMLILLGRLGKARAAAAAAYSAIAAARRGSVKRAA